MVHGRPHYYIEKEKKINWGAYLYIDNCPYVMALVWVYYIENNGNIREGNNHIFMYFKYIPQK